MAAAATGLITPSKWADLPPDLLGDVAVRLQDVAVRLQDVADLVRLHAVCTPWRDSLLSLTTTRPPSRLRFPPWLLIPCKGLVSHSVVDFGQTAARRPSCSDGVVLAEPPGVSFAGDNTDMTWVGSPDGTGLWLFTNTRLLNVLTGAVTQLPRFPEHDDRRYRRRMENLRGILYGDGTVFLYSFVPHCRRHVFTAAILRPGDAAWTFVKPKTNIRSNSSPCGATYRDGKILACVCNHRQFLVTLNDGGGGSGDQSRLQPWWTSTLERTHWRDSCYVLESHGELLSVSVLLKRDRDAEVDPEGALFLMVHALEEEEEVGGGGKMRWVERDGRRLADRVLFLGSPASFSVDVVDVVQLGMDGGCAYFVFRLGLFRYNLVNDEAKLVKRVSPVNGSNKDCIWLQPQPTIAPIHEIRKRIEAPMKKKQKKNLKSDA